jgi:glycogen debranching enzyme
MLLCILGAAADELEPLARFPEASSSLQIVSPCVPGKPWTVAGEHGALFGRQNGIFEAWQWPVKILSHFRISAELADYPVPIDVNALAAEIRVTPAETVIMYSHAAFTIRQHLFASRGAESGSQPAVAAFFEIESARPLDVTFSFTPEMLRMWPAPSFGRPTGEWVKQGSSGGYIVHTDNPDFSAVVGMPRTRPGIMVPYQEHPQTYPLELKLSFDPKRDRGVVFPLLMAIAKGNSAIVQLAELNTALPRLYSQTEDYYRHFFDHRLTAETPDSKLNEALEWAEVSIDQAQVRHQSETGLVAGYYESADSARPGYAWFFGRDSLFTTYATNSYGDLSLTKKALDFLIKRQRPDGKIMHEFSQAADAVNWKATPYFYAAADATPLFVMSMRDYVETSGDIDYLKAHWDAVRKAFEFTRAHDSDGDGIYENTEGTGWVESWPQGMPHQEIYLAAMDQQSAFAISQLAALMNDAELASAAAKKASEIKSKLEAEYFDTSRNFYAFSRNTDSSLDQTPSIYPAVAWWDGTLSLGKPGAMLTRWATAEFSTDWGLRDISNQTRFYDPISYHQGSVWPLFTGWVSLAEYRAGRPLSGYLHLMQNANLTWAQDLGSVTELLSGEFFQPLGRSSSHQTWSSAMVVTPMLRGMFGLRWDVPNRTLSIHPHLPADWDRAVLRNVPFGSGTVDLAFERMNRQIVIKAETKEPMRLCLTDKDVHGRKCESTPATAWTLSIPLPPVEISVPASLPGEGSSTAQLKVVDEQYSASQAVFVFEGQGGSSYSLPVRANRANVSATGADLHAGKLQVHFPEGSGYQRATVTFVW